MDPHGPHSDNAVSQDLAQWLWGDRCQVCLVNAKTLVLMGRTFWKGFYSKSRGSGYCSPPNSGGKNSSSSEISELVISNSSVSGNRAVVSFGFGSVWLAHTFRNSSRRGSTYALASLTLPNRRRPFITLHGRQQATRLSASFLPLRALATTKSTPMTRAFSKLALPFNPQYRQRN